MKPLYALAVAAAVLGLAAPAAADEPKKDDTAAKLVGAWEITKATDEPLVGATITFTKDGKFTLVLKVNGEEMTIEGTYTIEDGKLVTKSAGNDGDTDTIKKLTADAMELENKDKKVTVLKKKKK
jgi:uncharacterized protein (TIGR03066 family)